MKFPIERKPQMSPVPGGELILLLLQFGSIQRRAVTVVSPE